MSRFLQLALDLFDAPAPPPAAAAPAPPEPFPPPAPAAVVACAPAEPLESVLAPVQFGHPRATRQALLEGSCVAYELRRAKRRNIGFTVGAEGLTVTAPKWVPLYEIDAAVRSKSAWILRKLDEMRERQRKIESARIVWKDGTSVPFMGEQVIVVLDARQSGAVLNTAGEALPGVPRFTLHIGLPQSATAEQIRDTVQAWLMRQAKRVFTERLDHFAPLLGVQWKKLALSSAGTRWGTAHSDGSIRLNWRLIHFRMPVIDYVVAHELAHLRVMDHSPRFWDTVATVVPDYAQRRSVLRDEAIPTW
ncbi:MAG TPA: SprT family zinc-dependent metalloprotease [Ramlibacter sp.]|nr:SprT family zinc-dependent metalloprotease [Ramlibacter sp.]